MNAIAFRQGSKESVIPAIMDWPFCCMLTINTEGLVNSEYLGLIPSILLSQYLNTFSVVKHILCLVSYSLFFIIDLIYFLSQ